jgi:hypothetical protein
MSKYQAWILKERHLTPLTDVIVIDTMGNIRRHIQNTYECPYCHKTYTCSLSNKITFRKCRYCNNSVSPYKGDITDFIYLPEGVETF